VTAGIGTQRNTRSTENRCCRQREHAAISHDAARMQGIEQRMKAKRPI
jgi:hypothetical protein